MAREPELTIRREVVYTKRVNGKDVIDVLSCGHEIRLYRGRGKRAKKLEDRLCKKCVEEGRRR